MAGTGLWRRLRATAIAVMACGGVATAAAALAPAAQAAKPCGTEVAAWTYDLTRSGSISCTTARRIFRTFIVGGTGVHRHSTDGTVAGTSYTLSRYPGWRCFQGSGGGGCNRGARRADYTSRPTPPGEDWTRKAPAYTVILASRHFQSDVAEVLRRANARRLWSGLLYSTNYRSLRRGYWVVFTGEYSTRAAAVTHQRRAQRLGFSDADVRLVKR